MCKRMSHFAKVTIKNIFIDFRKISNGTAVLCLANVVNLSSFCAWAFSCLREWTNNIRILINTYQPVTGRRPWVSLDLFQCDLDRVPGPRRPGDPETAGGPRRRLTAGSSPGSPGCTPTHATNYIHKNSLCTKTKYRYEHKYKPELGNNILYIYIYIYYLFSNKIKIY